MKEPSHNRIWPVDTYTEYHFKVLLLANISNIYNPFSFFFIKAIPTDHKQHSQLEWDECTLQNIRKFWVNNNSLIQNEHLNMHKQNYKQSSN